VAVETVPAAKGGLLTILNARPGLDGVQVEWTHPGASIANECIYFGATDDTQEARALGNRRRRETYIIEVVVTVLKRGNDPRAAEERCWQLVGEVTDAVRDDPQLNSTVGVAQVSRVRHNNFPGAQERVSEAVIDVSVESRI
jgi:hypothetical protein